MDNINTTSITRGEWIQLMKEAVSIGLSVEDVRVFLEEPHQINISIWKEEREK
ncbi:anti-repressor SinI family protein [Lentibacillus saliphilus]|uniref:anti-repressor SinI family protein n=1 Tax=Lentibacillus saliphilus TaxID=2737028 RepID=UPI0031BB1121